MVLVRRSKPSSSFLQKKMVPKNSELQCVDGRCTSLKRSVHDRKKPLTAVWHKAVFSAVVFLLALLSAEIGLRVIAHTTPASIDGRATHFSQDLYPSTYDRDLGYVPRSHSSHQHMWGVQITLGDDGIRSNGRVRTHQVSPILAVGDSFTFGDEVGDEATWPAHLEGATGYPILNAGVFGYGLDQAILRSEQLVGKYNPSTVILSFTPADIARCEMAVYYSYKPYFEVQRNRLVLRREHMPDVLPNPSVIKRLLRSSSLAHGLFSRVLPGWWLQSFREVRAHHQGLQVACLLMERVAKMALEDRLIVVVVAQPESTVVWPYHRQDQRAREVLNCARRQGLASLNLVKEYRLLLRSDPDLHARFFNPNGVHMTSEGNAWVAERIWVKLKSDFPALFETDQQEEAVGSPGESS